MSSAFPGQFSPIPNSFQAIALTNGAAQFLTVPSGANGKAKYALIQALTADVNWRDDSVAPTAAVGGGMVVPSAQAPIGFLGDLSTLQFISTASGGSTLLVSYYS